MAQNNASTGAPTITGTAEVRQTLTANLGTIADADGLSATFPDDYSFQWHGGLMGDVPISGATSSTYRPGAADLGHSITVQVSFTDDLGNAESRTSAGTAAVVADATPPTVVASESGYYSDNALTTALSGTQAGGTSIYTKVKFSESVTRTRSNTAGARPEIFYRIWTGTAVQFDIVADSATLATGDCKRSATDSNEYHCLYTTTSSDTEYFTFEVGTNTRDLANNALANRYAHATTLALVDTRLSALALSDVPLSPAFSSAETSYTAWVANSLSRVTVTATANDPDATIAYLDRDNSLLTDADSATGFQVDVPLVDNIIKVRVTVGTTARTYTVRVTKRNVPPTARDSEVSTPANRVYVFRPADFNFSDRNPDDRLESVTFRDSPGEGEGTLRFNGEYIAKEGGISPGRYQLERGLITYWPPRGASGDAFTSMRFWVSDGESASTDLRRRDENGDFEGMYTMTINITEPVMEEPAVPGDDVLVSNIGQRSHRFTKEAYQNWRAGQGFTTGGHSAGYDLAGIVVQIAEASAATPDFDLYSSVVDNKYDTRKPGAWIANLQGSVATAGLQVFTPTAAVKLAADTTYFVVFHSGSTTTGRHGIKTPIRIQLAATMSSLDDVGEEAGWSILTHGRTRNLRYGWGGRGWRVKMAVRGTVATGQSEADPPTVEGTPVLSGAGDDGTWSEGETVRVDLTFSESVDVDTSEGTPLLGIELGDGGTVTRSAEYERGSGTATLTFAYTLVAGDGEHTSMAVTPDSLVLDGGTIRSSETAFDALLGHLGAVVQGGGGGSRSSPEVAFHDVPESHDGETPFTLTVAFGGAPDGLSPKRDAGSTFELEGGAITKSRQAPGQSSGTWELTVTPAGTGGVTVRVPTRRCSEAHAVCIGGRVLSEAAEVTIAGTQGTDNAMTARVTAASASHDGSTSFEMDFEFSHAPQSLSYRTVRDDLFDVTGGLIVGAKRLTRGESLGWRLTVQPDGDGAVTVSARATSDCEAAYAVCDAEGRMFDGGLEHTVPGPASEPESETLPVVSIAAGETPVREGSDLAFTLSRTGAADAALTVNVTVSESGDVLASDPPTSVTFAAGSATATLSVATVDDETEEDASTVTATLAAGSGYAVDADANEAEGQVESDDLAPITARFTKVAGEHDGSSAFSLEFEFSHEPAEYSYKTVRNHLFDVTGGAIEKARRLVKGSNLGWELRVAPDGFGEVRLAARATTDCGAAYAARDAAGRKFDGALSATIAGPPTLSVADATVEEVEGATLDFVVTLSRALAETVTVGYATSDGTTSAGADYTETTGTLTFAENEIAKTVSVPVLDDAHDEGVETLTLTLSNPSPSTVKLEDAHATGTITNSDPLQRAWLSRFGRTVGTHVVDAVGARLWGGAEAGSHVTVGGYRLPLGRQQAGESRAPGGPEPANPFTAGGSGAGAGDETASAPGGPDTDEGALGAKRWGPLSPDAAAEPPGRLATLVVEVARVLGVGSGAGPAAEGADAGLPPGWDAWLDGAAGDPRLGQSRTLDIGRTLTRRQMLLGSSFRLNLQAAEAGAGTPRFTAWGRGAGTRFDGRDGDLTLDGEVITGTVGVDGEWERLLAGVAVAHSRGDGAFRLPGTAARGQGELEQTLTSLHPYLRYAVTDRLDVWGLLGYGWGEMDVAMANETTLTTDTGLVMGAFGGRGVLLPAAAGGGVELATRTDAMLTRTSADAAVNTAATEADAHRVRVILEGSRGVTWAGGRSFTPTVEMGLRHDWGDAETGFGLELGGRVQYADPRLGLTIAGAVRGLLAHEESDYREWGASGTVRLAPGANGHGLAFALSPTWGATASGVEGLWNRQSTQGLAPQGTGQAPAGQLAADVGYGLAAPFGRGLVTPYAGTVLAEGATRTYRVGMRLQMPGIGATGLTLSLEGQRQEPEGAQPATHGVHLQVNWRF